jgi:hypothetical protein
MALLTYHILYFFFTLSLSLLLLRWGVVWPKAAATPYLGLPVSVPDGEEEVHEEDEPQLEEHLATLQLLSL